MNEAYILIFDGLKVKTTQIRDRPFWTQHGLKIAHYFCRVWVSQSRSFKSENQRTIY